MQKHWPWKELTIISLLSDDESDFWVTMTFKSLMLVRIKPNHNTFQFSHHWEQSQDQI
jgi:hypothetical protein